MNHQGEGAPLGPHVPLGFELTLRQVRSHADITVACLLLNKHAITVTTCSGTAQASFSAANRRGSLDASRYVLTDWATQAAGDACLQLLVLTSQPDIQAGMALPSVFGFCHRVTVTPSPSHLAKGSLNGQGLAL
jgi:hypothetical protein